MLINNQKDNNFLSILADGTIRQIVPEGTEGSVVREYEDSKGNKGVKTEMVYTEVTGLVTKVAFYEGDYGKLLQLTITDGEDEHVLSVSTASNFGEDIMKKLMSIKMDEQCRFAPYAFTDDKGKMKKGVTIYQGENKVSDYFHDADKKPLHGYPEIPAGHGKKPVTTDEWKMYFMQARMFMIGAIEKHFGLDAGEDLVTTDF